jgi:phosphotransferase system enzyme I (PtsI)
VIRTFDLGADKLPEGLTFASGKEPNPFMGLRSIRLSLRNTEMFRVQLRAILRASVFGKIRVMFPLVSTITEFRQAKMIFRDVCEELAEENIPFDPDIPLGIMVETPATALMLELFVHEVDFFSIGTNDLLQYTMAVDRGNERVASLYRPFHPVILRLIRNVVKSAERAGVWVSVCGEMAANPMYIPLLAGLGIRELSMSTVSLAPAKRVIRNMKYIDAEAVAERALKCSSQEEVLELAQTFLRKIAPDVSDLNIN